MQNVIELASTILKTTDIETLESYVKWLKEGQRFTELLADKKDTPSKIQQITETSSGVRRALTNGKCHTAFLRYSDCMSYTEAIHIIVSAGIKSVLEFQIWVRDGKRPINFPGSPDRAYRSQWSGWSNFFDAGHIATGARTIRSSKKMSYREARKFLRQEGITGFVQLQQWFKAKKRPSSFPSDPRDHYTRHGEWKGWDDFFHMSRASIHA